MGKIFYLMGKSASGKDGLCRELSRRFEGQLGTVVLYSTRPIRSGETEGNPYFFIDEARFQELKRQGRVIEARTYPTVHGPWTYATIDDGQIDLSRYSYLMVGTPEGFLGMSAYFGRQAMVPLYIEVEDGVRLSRALARERAEKQPKYAEMCRRFLADAADFAPEKLDELGLDRIYENKDFNACVDELEARIRKETL